MNKKLNLFAAIPLYGSIIVLIWLFVKSIRKELSMKKFILYFCSCAIVGFLSMLLMVLLINLFNIENGLLRIVYAIIGAGYIMNLYTFLTLNKIWDKLCDKQ